ncbi:DUF602-domain-containing protein [Saccharata proteae CBS 121410]|uniref:DUF602-domain-containing protein n=1 Tax=Saccharata proteae CBS 121410 TaxID=1314787 RepID=A0A9P4HW82_9PEZI|nr:DUF602-domain-containing protein [Saccharata proteae CBS 121410]
MGNDGGSIPTRRELVKEAARNPTTAELKETQKEAEAHNWRIDPLSHKPLARPIVSDSLGRLFNKDSVLEFLLPSEESKEEAEKLLQGAVRSLKDVVEIKFELEAEDGKNAEGETWVCPITNKTLGPGSKAVYIVPCGHAFAGSVVKEVNEDKCLQCNESYAENDVIPIIPTSETDIARLQLRMQTLKEKGLTHSLKKAPGMGKKRKKAAAGDAKKPVIKRNGSAASKEVPHGSASGPTTPADGRIKNAATASLTAKVLAEQEERNKRRKMDTNENLKSLFSSRDQSQPHGKSSDFMVRGYTIPANAKR